MGGGDLVWLGFPPIDISGGGEVRHLGSKTSFRPRETADPSKPSRVPLNQVQSLEGPPGGSRKCVIGRGRSSRAFTLILATKFFSREFGR